MPVFLFSVLFGLSMDCQVFLLSRIRERYTHSRDTTDSLISGVGSRSRRRRDRSGEVEKPPLHVVIGDAGRSEPRTPGGWPHPESRVSSTAARRPRRQTAAIVMTPSPERRSHG